MLYSISKLLSLSFFSFDLTAESEKAVLASATTINSVPNEEP